MTNQALMCLLGLLAAPVHAALAVDVRWLPQEITLALVPAAAATTGLLLALLGVIRRESPERLRRSCWWATCSAPRSGSQGS